MSNNMRSKSYSNKKLLGYFQANSTAAPAATCASKRKAEVADLKVTKERPVRKPFTPVVETPAKKEKDPLYQISITVHPDLDKYPRALRDVLQEACQTAFYKYMLALQAGKLPGHHQTYSIVAGERVRSESVTFENKTVYSNVVDLSIANATLLKYFTGRPGDRVGKKFFHEQRHEGLKNPEFLELYSARRGEVAWGLDVGGCLSFYETQLVEKKTKECVWYVKAGSINLDGES